MNGTASSILVVNDDVDSCSNMADILGDMGFDVNVAHEGTTAMDLVRRRAYDVALLDYRMPGMDGVTLCREIQRVRSGVVLMLVTAYAEAETTRDALDAGAWQVLSKPVHLPRLIGLVNEAIGQPLVLVVNDDFDLCGRTPGHLARAWVPGLYRPRRGRGDRSAARVNTSRLARPPTPRSRRGRGPCLGSGRRIQPPGLS